MINLNQSELSRRGPSLLEDEFDIKNCLVDLTQNRQYGSRHRQSLKEKFDGSGLVELHTFAKEEDIKDQMKNVHLYETAQSIEDNTDKLSNLVRQIEDNSKINLPSTMTIKSYISQVQDGFDGTQKTLNRSAELQKILDNEDNLEDEQDVVVDNSNTEI